MERSDGISIRDTHMSATAEGGTSHCRYCQSSDTPSPVPKLCTSVIHVHVNNGASADGSVRHWLGGACAAYGGPWVRWSVIRANALSGISQASLNESAKTGAPPACAAVSIFSSGYTYPPKGGSESTSDVVAEQNMFGTQHCCLLPDCLRATSVTVGERHFASVRPPQSVR